MEEVLRQLREAMVTYRQTIAGMSAPRASAAAVPLVASPDRRAACVQALVRDIERVCGLEISGIMEAKLGRVLASVALPALEEWGARLHHLPPDDPDWLSLVESLTVHETFFHRDRAQFELLRYGILPELIAAARREGGHCLRLWSAGCATGEEAYTLAIVVLLALRDAGYARDTLDGGIACDAPWQVDVLGSDISRVVLTRARTATYAAQELGPFRQLPEEFERFFPPLPPSLDAPGLVMRGVHPTLARHVRFGHFNLMADAPPETGFDIVLCRNVLIYLAIAARARALSTIRQALRSVGYLMLGPTDAPADPAAYETRWGDGAVAYRLKPAHG